MQCASALWCAGWCYNSGRFGHVFVPYYSTADTSITQRINCGCVQCCCRFTVGLLGVCGCCIPALGAGCPGLICMFDSLASKATGLVLIYISSCWLLPASSRAIAVALCDLQCTPSCRPVVATYISGQRQVFERRSSSKCVPAAVCVSWHFILRSCYPWPATSCFVPICGCLETV
jgi:hypothetical protein